jgi:MYXO-CTERM domain-containing protein
MTLRHSIIAMCGAAFLLCTPGALNAQQPVPPPDKDTTVTVTRDDDDRNFGWIGLLGLLGLAGLLGRRRDVGVRTTTTRT